MAKRKFNTESEIRNFKSKVLLLPRKLLFQINQMIEDGRREWAIEGFLKREYHGTLGVPTPPTISVYIDYYLAKKKFQQEKGIINTPSSTEIAILEGQEVENIEKEHHIILDQTTSVEDKKKLLELLIKKCIQRIKKVESLQEVEGVTASLEAVIGSYLREVHSIVSTQLKLSGELQSEQNEVIGQLVNRNLYQLVAIIFQVITTLIPEKSEEIKNKVFEKLKESKELADILMVPLDTKKE